MKINKNCEKYLQQDKKLSANFFKHEQIPVRILGNFIFIKAYLYTLFIPILYSITLYLVSKNTK